MAALGSIAPQLCGIIPNAVGVAICNVAVRVAVTAFTGVAQVNSGQQPQPAAIEECPPERRLSTGHCLPPDVNPPPQEVTP